MGAWWSPAITWFGSVTAGVITEGASCTFDRQAAAAALKQRRLTAPQESVENRRSNAQITMGLQLTRSFQTALGRLLGVLNSRIAVQTAIDRAVKLDRSNVRRRFEERFTARRMAEDYVRIYESAIKAGRRRPENGIGALRASAE